MRFCVAVAGIFLFAATDEYAAGKSVRNDPAARAMASLARAILREASELTRKQNKGESYWTDRVLLAIGELQIRAGDCDGALRSIRSSGYQAGRQFGLLSLARALARAGKKDRALEMSPWLDRDFGWGPNYLKSAVQLPWAEHLIAARKLELAGKAVEQIESLRDRRRGLQELAVAWAKSGDPARATKHFDQAIAVVGGLKDEFGRASGLWEIAEAQRTLGADAAKATMHRLADETVSFKDPWAKVSALRECAVLTAKLEDRKAARSFFALAVEGSRAVDKSNKLGALQNTHNRLDDQAQRKRLWQ
jgi:hypothetical protein